MRRLDVETPHMAHLHKAVENMAEMMSQADIAFGCGGQPVGNGALWFTQFAYNRGR